MRRVGTAVAARLSRLSVRLRLTLAFAGAAAGFREDVDFDRLLGAVRLRHGGDADEYALLDVGQRLAIDGKDLGVIRELDFRRDAVTAFDVHRLAVDAFDRAAHAHRVR